MTFVKMLQNFTIFFENVVQKNWFVVFYLYQVTLYGKIKSETKKLHSKSFMMEIFLDKCFPEFKQKVFAFIPRTDLF